MNIQAAKCAIAVFLISFSTSITILHAQDYKELLPPEQKGNWILPAQGEPARPVWGHLNGIRVGIAPMPGPRGLLRIYAPYLGHKEERMINFIALEPIPAGDSRRGFSELERSRLDDKQGKRFWSSNKPECSQVLQEIFPASGVIQKINGTETLTVYIFSEPFDNGAKVYSRLRFYADRPFEVELTTNRCADSKDLESFILTATMGNYARLRTLYLEDTTKTSQQLWPEYTDIHFTPHDSIPPYKMIKGRNGGIYFIAAPNEKDPENAEYAPGTGGNWKYYGKNATQYWYAPDPDEDLRGLVNGRYTYWAGKSPIPGGISIENFEFKAPFRNGERFIFGVSPLTPETFIRKVKQ